MDTGATAFYEERFLELRERLVRILGVSTVNRLVERAVAEIGRAHPALRGLRCDEDQIDLAPVRRALEGKGDATVRDAYAALDGVLLLLVARLLGREVAQRLTEGMSLGDLLREGMMRDV